ncbi:MAG: carbohydrate ABC transporter permease [Dictyoglomus turgidum]|uniref:Binding-protein-dependent transport systems inner membrane component n=1 Tax=Dictyoglomus turgidum (strain DSM 6724 / Z-1310) TaxID=515635 RepID=B8DZ07_DICTD|nr:MULTISPECIES: carbohydrate ABC transporter permease [Dictyoglomus]ACK41633.1 binding-protein-dependent transport systems inner membrane component [Dictyoglomus turgidum DSM 6724]HBU32018.1 carbohydrate ABC transporter permease [Dictyoglomus sp.]
MKRSLGEKTFDIVNYGLMILLVIITLYPFLYVLAVSLNDPFDTIKGGITIFPRIFTLDNYKEIFNYPSIGRAALISTLRTIIGTIIGVFSTAIVAYVLSRRDFFARKLITTLFVITMYVGGGLVPEYLLIRGLGLMNNFLVYILPGLINPFNLILIRAYIDTLPSELQESAMIDGANDFIIFLKIILPLSLPVLATVALFVAVGHWNSWFDTYLYCGGNKNLTTLQYELQKILANAAASSTTIDYYSNLDPTRTMRVTPQSLRMAMTIITTLPIVLVYPFLQKYFIKGMTLGAIKN